MPNIQNIPILQDEAMVWQNGVAIPFDLMCSATSNKRFVNVFATLTGNVVTEVSSPYPIGTIRVTKIINPCDNTFAYTFVEAGVLTDLLTYDCDACKTFVEPKLDIVPYVKHFNLSDELVGLTEITDPEFLNIPIDPVTGLYLMWVERDRGDLYEKQWAYNGFVLAGSTITLDSPLYNGEQLAVKFFKKVMI